MVVPTKKPYTRPEKLEALNVCRLLSSDVFVIESEELVFWGYGVALEPELDEWEGGVFNDSENANDATLC